MGHNVVPLPPGVEAAPKSRSRLGPVCGLVLVGCWAPILVIIFRLPSLVDSSVVVAYWGQWGATTQTVIAIVALGYPPLLVFLIDLRARWTTVDPDQVIVSQTSVALLIMFVTCLNVALGLASAGGQLIAAGRTDLGYALHVAWAKVPVFSGPK